MKDLSKSSKTIETKIMTRALNNTTHQTRATINEEATTKKENNMAEEEEVTETIMPKIIDQITKISTKVVKAAMEEEEAEEEVEDKTEELQKTHSPIETTIPHHNVSIIKF